MGIYSVFFFECLRLRWCIEAWFSEIIDYFHIYEQTVEVINILLTLDGNMFSD